jgi:CRISPR-associated protein Csb1
MTIDLSALDKTQRLIFTIPLAPLLGQRFQPTGFPGLGAATFRSPTGDCLLVESPQSMANRLELTLWDEATNDVKPDVQGISHVRVKRHGAFLTDTILESHRLNSPYLLEESSKAFFNGCRSISNH